MVCVDVMDCMNGMMMDDDYWNDDVDYDNDDNDNNNNNWNRRNSRIDYGVPEKVY